MGMGPLVTISRIESTLRKRSSGGHSKDGFGVYKTKVRVSIPFKFTIRTIIKKRTKDEKECLWYFYTKSILKSKLFEISFYIRNFHMGFRRHLYHFIFFG